MHNAHFCIRSMKIYGISVATFERSLAIIQEWDLLGNDALHIAGMEEHSIGAIATYIRNFSRVSGIPHFSFPSATPRFSERCATSRPVEPVGIIVFGWG